MFTGIIKAVGNIAKISDKKLIIKTDLARKLHQGSSICVDGVCLTVTRIGKGKFTADVMPETLTKTNFGARNILDLVNLEFAMPANSRLEGHIVTGHVEGAGKIIKIQKQGNSHIITIQIPTGLSLYVVPKGSIAINGVSLTVISIKKNIVTVGIIPYTWDKTNFNALKIGSKVNIETDIIAKYFEKWQK